ncbi:MAG: SRPBCC family protein [Solirubrobacterales bacterium]
MGPISAEIEIDVPRSRAFALIADLAWRPSFTDHFISDFRLTRVDSSGLGAGARFRLVVPPRRLWMDTAITELEAPRRIVERGLGGRGNRVPATTVWRLLEVPGSLTTVHVSQRIEVSHPLSRAVDAASGTSIRYQRAWRRALHRLRDLLEEGASSQQRVAVAGGNPHTTDVP